MAVKFLIFTLVFAWLAACSPKKNATQSSDHEHSESSKVETYYTCSMHPQIREDKPGKCPICHMNLTKVTVEKDQDKKTSDSSAKTLQLWQCKDFPEVTSQKPDPCPIDGTPMVKSSMGNLAEEIIAKVKLRKSQINHFRPSLFPVTTMKMQKKIRLLGAVVQSEERERNISAKIYGRVEKVYVRSTGSAIRKGDPVVDIYSPELINAVDEYFIARKSYLKNRRKDLRNLLSQSEERLKHWGLKPFQYESWFKAGKIPKNITVYSTVSGIVRERNAVEGKYFKEGENYFELSDLSSVWVEIDVYEQDASLISIGQKVELEFIALPGEVIVGEVDFINPVLDTDSRTLKIRSTIENTTGKLRPGMVAEATLTVEFDGLPLVVPRTAIIDTGKRKVAWVKVDEKTYQGKIIHTGHESEGYIEVKSGLKENEEVVIEGNFLLDAQAQLFGGYESFKNP